MHRSISFGFWGSSTPSNRTVYNWFAKFQRTCTLLNDKFREGRPSVVATNVDAARETIERDRHVTYREIRASLGIDAKAIRTILHDRLSSPVGSHTI